MTSCSKHSCTTPLLTRPLLRAWVRVVHRYEDWLEAVVGADGIARLRVTLTTIVDGA